MLIKKCQLRFSWHVCLDTRSWCVFCVLFVSFICLFLLFCLAQTKETDIPTGKLGASYGPKLSQERAPSPLGPATPSKPGTGCCKEKGYSQCHAVTRLQGNLAQIQFSLYMLYNAAELYSKRKNHDPWGAFTCISTMLIVRADGCLFPQFM